MQIAVCDDVKDYNDKLDNLLASYIKRKDICKCEINKYTSGLALLKNYVPGKYNFIFLDVDMPVLDGFKTAEQIRKLDLKVDLIFVTNMHDQAQMGYNYNAKGYLYKEVNQKQIDILMDRLLNELGRRNDGGFYKIHLKFDDGIIYLPLYNVLYFESKNKDILATTTDDVFTFRGQLADVANDLKDKGFIRIHRSYLVNIEHVFKDFGNKLILKSSDELEISRKYKGAIENALKGKW